MSLRKAINEKCRDCTYDPLSKGSWRQQVYLCASKSCPLWAQRAKPSTRIPESTLCWYGVDLAEYQCLMEG